uniref:F-box domain-containing protein n=1 Tax=Parastrongyloides trichosuri TaxID=131310 RepID=A0A0N4ZHX6_PARTI
MAKNSDTYFDLYNLPDEIINLVFQRCTFMDISPIMLSCKRFKNIVDKHRSNLPKASLKHLQIEHRVIHDNIVTDAYSVIMRYDVKGVGEKGLYSKTFNKYNCKESEIALYINSCTWEGVENVQIIIRKKSNVLNLITPLLNSLPNHSIKTLFLHVEGKNMRHSLDNFLSSLRNVKDMFINKLCLCNDNIGFQGKMNISNLEKIEVLECDCTYYCNEQFALPVYHMNKGHFSMFLCVNDTNFKMKLINAAAEEYVNDIEHYKQDFIAISELNPSIFHEIDIIMTKNGLKYEPNFEDQATNCSFCHLMIAKDDEEFWNVIEDSRKQHLIVSIVALHRTSKVVCSIWNR